MGMGIGDWGLGIGDWGLGIGSQSPIPNPQSPIPNPQSPCIIIININFKFYILFLYFIILNIKDHYFNKNYNK